MSADVIADWGLAFEKALARGDTDYARKCFDHVLKQWRAAWDRERRALENVRVLLADMERK